MIVHVLENILQKHSYQCIVNLELFLYRYNCPEEEYAEQLRRQQSAKWSMDT